MAARVRLYATPTVPPGRLEVVTEGAETAAAMVIERLAVPDRLALVTWTVNAAVSAVVGVPEIVPALDRLSPAGKEPELIDQL